VGNQVRWRSIRRLIRKAVAMKIPEKYHAPLLVAVISVAMLALLFFMSWAVYNNR
jgi:hypothetical protein